MKKILFLIMIAAMLTAPAKGMQMGTQNDRKTTRSQSADRCSQCVLCSCVMPICTAYMCVTDAARCTHAACSNPGSCDREAFCTTSMFLQIWAETIKDLARSYDNKTE